MCDTMPANPTWESEEEGVSEGLNCPTTTSVLVPHTTLEFEAQSFFTGDEILTNPPIKTVNKPIPQTGFLWLVGWLNLQS